MPFEATYSCSDCGHRFVVTTDDKPKGRCPGCPRCKLMDKSTLKSTTKSNKSYTKKQLDKNVKEMVESKQAPSFGIKSNFNKAIDATAEIVMQDYGMTDINLDSRLRAGDNCVPKLSHELEQKVDKVFAPQPSNVMGQQSANLNAALKKQINAGMYKNQGDPVNRATESIQRRPTDVMFHHTEKPGKPN